MSIPYYQVDAFAEKAFAGNPAGICPLEEWLPDKMMQNIAMENNLSETAFFVHEGECFHLRWFTPVLEVDLCGHATLAAAFVVFEQLNHPEPVIRFQTRSGILSVEKDGNDLMIDFPSRPPSKCDAPDGLLESFNMKPDQVMRNERDYFLVFKTAAEIGALKPDFGRLARVECLGVITTAPGEGEVDFVSRFFAPSAGINEDPVTGSAHVCLTPYWADALGKKALLAHQISRRGGVIRCEANGDRVRISGKARLFMTGEIVI